MARVGRLGGIGQASVAGLRINDRYMISGEIASGGMATVYVGRLVGPVGFGRTIAIKRLHEQYAKDPEFVAMFLDEARVAARVRHPNVVPTLDVVAVSGELFIVMEYVEGESLSGLTRSLKGQPVPVAIASAIMTGLLQGLHAAHEAKDEHGHALDIVHRDVSPQNVLIGMDGIARVVDFGVAKAAGRQHTTQEGFVKGKAAYMAPEQVTAQALDRRVDVFAAGVLLWELVTGKRLFAGETPIARMAQVLDLPIVAPSSVEASVPAAVDAVALKALSRVPSERFATASEMAAALEQAARPATAREVGAWIASRVGASLTARASQIAELERAAVQAPATELVRGVPPSSPTPSGLPEISIIEEVLTHADDATRNQRAIAPASDSAPRSAPTTSPSSRRRFGIVAMGALVAILFVLVFAVGRMTATGDAPASSTSRSPSAATSAASSASAVPASAIVTAIASASASASAAPPASAETKTPTPTTPTPPTPPTPRATPTTRASSGGKPSAPSCDPPYRIDADGVRVPKRECL